MWLFVDLVVRAITGWSRVAIGIESFIREITSLRIAPGKLRNSSLKSHRAFHPSAFPFRASFCLPPFCSCLEQLPASSADIKLSDIAARFAAIRDN